MSEQLSLQPEDEAPTEAPAVTMTADDGYAFRGTWGTRPEGVCPGRIF